MGRVVVAGTGLIPFGKYAGTIARADVGSGGLGCALPMPALTAGDIGAVYFGNAAAGLLTGQEMVRGQAALRKLPLHGPAGLQYRECLRLELFGFFPGLVGGAGGTVRLRAGGRRRKIPASGQVVTSLALASAVDQDELAETRERLGAGASSIFMDLYAERVRAYASRTGATPEDFANVAVKSRAAGAANPNAYIRKPAARDEVLASRMISEPLTMLMCAPNADGAAAVVLCSEGFARQHGLGPVFVRSCAVTSGIPDHDADGLVERAAAKAYQRAELGPRRRRCRRVA